MSFKWVIRDNSAGKYFTQSGNLVDNAADARLYGNLSSAVNSNQWYWQKRQGYDYSIVKVQLQVISEEVVR